MSTNIDFKIIQGRFDGDGRFHRERPDIRTHEDGDFQESSDFMLRNRQAIIELGFLKNYLRVSHDYDDELILLHLSTAVEIVERFLEMQINQVMVSARIKVMKKVIDLPHRPIREIESVKLLDVDSIDVDHRVEVSSRIEVDLSSKLEFIELQSEQGIILCREASLLGKSLQVNYIAGLGEKLPPLMYNGILQLVRKLYESEPQDQIDANLIHNVFHNYRKVKI